MITWKGQCELCGQAVWLVMRYGTRSPVEIVDLRPRDGEYQPPHACEPPPESLEHEDDLAVQRAAEHAAGLGGET